MFNLASQNIKIQNESIKLAKKAILLSKKLKRPIYSFHAGFLADPKINELGGKIKKQLLGNRKDALKRFIKNVKLLSKYAKKHNVKLLIENNNLSEKEFNTFKKNSVLMATPSEIIYVLKRTPKNVGLLLDLAHLKVSSNSLKFNLIDAVKKLKKYVSGYHLSENNGREDSNKIFNKNTWFWPYIKKELNYYSIEIYNYDIKKIINALNLTKQKIKYMKIALITGVSGQDGSYLAEFLLKKGYIVHGIRRYSSTNTVKNLDFILNNKKLNKNFYLHYADVTDTDSIFRVIKRVKPLEIYNLAAQSHVHASFQVPEYTAQVDAISQLRIIEVVKQINPKIKIYQAATSELFGNSYQKSQNEKTPFRPVSPYSVAKLYGYYISKVYRDAYGMFITNGILFNHESPRRGTPTFVTKKITRAIKKIINGEIKYIELGNLNSKRDWGYAKEYVESMWLMLQQKKPDDFVISTGKVYSIRDFVKEAFKYVNINIKWKGKGLKEIGIDSKTKKVLVKIDPYFMRPNELHYLKGDFSKSKKILGWKPKVTFKELVKIMMEDELKN